MKNVLALIGLVTVVVKSFDWYCDYDSLKKERDAREAPGEPKKASK